jgi:protein-disulfide isomerase
VRLANVVAVGLVCAALWNQHTRIGRLEELSREPETAVVAAHDSVPYMPIRIGGLPSLGRMSASVVVVEFSDFHCPYCRSHALSILPELRRELIDSGRVRYVFAYMPLEMLHPRAMDAGMAAFCAHDQDRFWDMHDQFFKVPKSSQSERARLLAIDMRLDVNRYDSCVADRAEAAVRSSVIYGRSLGVTSTPTFFIGQPLAGDAVRVVTKVRGVTPVEELTQQINKVLASRAGDSESR